MGLKIKKKYGFKQDGAMRYSIKKPYAKNINSGKAIVGVGSKA